MEVLSKDEKKAFEILNNLANDYYHVMDRKYIADQSQELKSHLQTINLIRDRLIESRYKIAMK